MSDIARRTFITEPGESLLLLRSPLDRILRHEMFTEMTNLDDLAVVDSTLVSIPLPRYTKVAPDQRRFTDVDPSSLWHPLFWLPRRLVTRYLIDDETFGQELETDDSWALRVALEMSMSGVYDPATGGWVDVLALHGIDADADHERVARWLAGSFDRVLDSVTLEDHLATDDPGWGYEAAASLEPTLRGAAWSLSADHLLGVCDDIDESPDDSFTRAALSSVVDQAQVTINLADPGDGLPAAADFWPEAVSVVTSAEPESLRTDVRADLTAYLTAVREAYRPHLEAFLSLIGADTSESTEDLPPDL